MSLQKTIQKQYQRIVNDAAMRFIMPSGTMHNRPEGWIVTVRKALGMSGVQLARRMGITRAAISQREKAEPDGGVTLKQMQATAEALGCRFVYAIVPEKKVENVIRKQAQNKARTATKRASSHMALEKQSLTNQANEEIINDLAEDLVRNTPSNFWDDK